MPRWFKGCWLRGKQAKTGRDSNVNLNPALFFGNGSLFGHSFGRVEVRQVTVGKPLLFACGGLILIEEIEWKLRAVTQFGSKAEIEQHTRDVGGGCRSQEETCLADFFHTGAAVIALVGIDPGVDRLGIFASGNSHNPPVTDRVAGQDCIDVHTGCCLPVPFHQPGC